MLTLNDGRKELYQWDTGRTATVAIECDVVHFANLKYGDSLAVEVKGGEVSVPNKLLMSGEPIYCWAFVKDEDGAYTKKEQALDVIKRAKPSDYVYTETEVITVKTAVEKALEEAKESGDFKGEKGDKGDKGDPREVVQEVGQSETAVMSQKATTDEIDALRSDLDNLSITNINGVTKENYEYNQYVLATEVDIWENFIAETKVSKITGQRAMFSSNALTYETNDKYTTLKMPVKYGDVIRFKIMPYYFNTTNTGINFLFLHNSSNNTWSAKKIGFGDAATGYDILYSDLAENGFTIPSNTDYLLADIYQNYYLRDGSLQYNKTYSAEVVTINMPSSYTKYDGITKAQNYVPVVGNEYYVVNDDLRIQRYESKLGDIETILASIIGGDE